MNIKEIKEIIELMKENNIREFEMEREGLRILLKRNTPEGLEQIQVTPIAPHANTAKQNPAKPKIQQENDIQITSPMVGTFYTSPSPDASPYIVEGQDVNSDDVVCIIEAMKIMNEIKAEVKGKVKKVLVKNGEPVEFGQALFIVEKE